MSYLKELLRRKISGSSSVQVFDDAREKTPLFKVIQSMQINLKQADLHDDIDGRSLHEPIDKINNLGEKLLRRLTQYEMAVTGDKNQRLTISEDANFQQDLADFLENINTIYAHRTTSAKMKDFLWEVADCVVGALVAMGIAAAVIKLAGIGIFGGAFAKWVAPATTAATLEKSVGASVGVGGLLMKFAFFCYSDKRKINAAAQKTADLYHQRANNEQRSSPSRSA